MLEKIFMAGTDWTGLVLRISLGIVMLPHGAQKLLGWFGGYGFSGTMGFFTNTMKLPWIIGFLVIVIEFFGSLSLILGLGSRLWAASMLFLFLGIVITTHFKNGFFMNWFGNQAGEGYEYFLLAIGLSIAILINGSGIFSVDNLISKR